MIAAVLHGEVEVFRVYSLKQVVYARKRDVFKVALECAVEIVQVVV